MDYSVKCIYGKVKNARAAVAVPGSKSITARALLIAALADGRSTLYGAQLTGDCAEFISQHAFGFALRFLRTDSAAYGRQIVVGGDDVARPREIPVPDLQYERGNIYSDGAAGAA